ncbi:hypothetical protein [Aliivibrio sifiae]|uniref:hypothetical protein n=1 Tax=Aliivibrio sifiae TaxID=566293 RepID=UPI001FEAEF9B|nr:hypothetical protein [Aliivibrio sifiae]
MKLQRSNILLASFSLFGLLGWFLYIFNPQVNEPHPLQYDLLSPSMTVSYVRSQVWYHSRGKLVELKSILGQNLNNRTLKIKIENMLKHRTSVYINEFNSLKSSIPRLGNWYKENFDFKNFLNDVNIIACDENKSIPVKIDEITDVMELYQNKTTEKLSYKLKNIRG